jgi:excisionase family DNA binding protein
MKFIKNIQAPATFPLHQPLAMRPQEHSHNSLPVTQSIPVGEPLTRQTMQDMDEINRLATLDEVASALGASKRFVQSLVARKAIPVIRIGKRCTRFELPRVMAAVRRFELQEMGRR